MMQMPPMPATYIPNTPQNAAAKPNTAQTADNGEAGPKVCVCVCVCVCTTHTIHVYTLSLTIHTHMRKHTYTHTQSCIQVPKAYAEVGFREIINHVYTQDMYTHTHTHST